MDAERRRQVIGQRGREYGDESAGDVLIKRRNPITREEGIDSHDEDGDDKRQRRGQQPAAEDDREGRAHDAPADEDGADTARRRHLIDFVEDALGQRGRRGAGVDGADELIHGRELGEVHINARCHAEDRDRPAVRARAHVGVDGDRVHHDIDVAVVQAIGRRCEVNLGARVRVRGTSADEDLADARGDFHHARHLRRVREIDRCQRRRRGCGLGRVNRGDACAGVAEEAAAQLASPAAELIFEMCHCVYVCLALKWGPRP